MCDGFQILQTRIILGVPLFQETSMFSFVIRSDFHFEGHPQVISMPAGVCVCVCLAWQDTLTKGSKTATQPVESPPKKILGSCNKSSLRSRGGTIYCISNTRCCKNVCSRNSMHVRGHVWVIDVICNSFLGH